MICYCPDCKRIYKNYQRDITQSHDIYSNINNGKLEETSIPTCDTSSHSYCPSNSMHQNLKFISTNNLKTDELVELLSYFKIINNEPMLACIIPKECAASTLARLQTLLKINEVIK